ncbi:hypothetical protein [Streptomyces nodosus]|uniref:hypothetical protein n=1 Tax=Streptomyces nodosus TaxID=40318 RepID=UPI0018054E60|nr:hypothetical protein [Streptomyces nodosus]MBB4789679.1 hypothetical protein [Streptomyces nodosus]
MSDVDVAAAGDTGSPAGDPLALAGLFAGGGEPWLPLLGSVIEAQPGVADFIGPKRSPEVVPVRELTFQALKPHPPEKWKVVVLGQKSGSRRFDRRTDHGWRRLLAGG